MVKSTKPSFNFRGFYRALADTVAARAATWKIVSDETGVSQTTLSRMARGRQPDAESLASLSSWSGLNPADYVSGPRRQVESLALMGKLIREDPHLDPANAEALEAIVRTAYTQMRKPTS